MPALDIVKGLMVTARHLGRKPVTVQYPEEKKQYAPRYHGRHQLNRYADGLERCIGCELCAWACPADAIFVQGAGNGPDARYSPGERYAVDYQINYLRCILCGLCIEACPTRALTMTQEDDLTGDSREGLIFTKEMLLAPPPPGVAPTPHSDEEVRAAGLDYYGGYAMTTKLASAERAARLAPHGSSAAAGRGTPPASHEAQHEGAVVGPAPEAERGIGEEDRPPAFLPDARSEDIVPPRPDRQALTQQILPEERPAR